MITLKLTAKNIELIIHSLGSEGIRLNDDNFISLRDKLVEQMGMARKKRKPVMQTFTIYGHKFQGTIDEAMQGVSGFENDPNGFKPDLLTWCKDNLTEIK